MNKEKRRVPKLRFPGFTEDWEQRKFVDLFEYERPDAYIVKSDNYNDNFNIPVLTANKAFILGYTNEKNSYDKPSIIFDDFTLDRKYVDFPYMLKSSAIKILTSKSQHNLRFLFERLNATRFEVLGHARHYISVVQNTTTLCPSFEEEVCISNLLTKFDELLTLHQRKLEHLNLKKKALLQKLFPKNGECYPELRFPGFTDAWEQRKLDDIARIKTGGGTPKTANLEYWSGNIPWIQSSDLVEGDIVHVNINKFINNNALKNSAAKLISRDSITLVTRVGVGKVAVINQDFTTSQDFLSLSDFDRSDIKFLAYQLYRLMQENAKVLQGTSIKGITKTELIEQSISIPSSNQEQNLIANVLSKIDSIITLHQRKLDHLQLQKKALLQQMFV